MVAHSIVLIVSLFPSCFAWQTNSWRHLPNSTAITEEEEEEEEAALGETLTPAQTRQTSIQILMFQIMRKNMEFYLPLFYYPCYRTFLRMTCVSN